MPFSDVASPKITHIPKTILNSPKNYPTKIISLL